MGIKNIPHIKGSETSEENYNAIPILAYWDIYKNYYANKQEEFGYRIDNESYIIDRYVVVWQESQRFTYTIGVYDIVFSNPETESLTLQAHGFENEDISEKLRFVMFDGNDTVTVKWDDLFATKNWNQILNRYSFYNYKTGKQGWELKNVTTTSDIAEQRISLKRFPLSNIDDVQINILKKDIHNALS